MLNNAFYTALRQYIQTSVAESKSIPVERRQRLEGVSEYVSKRITAGKPARLIFICTHNSRRSQMSQLWAQAVTRYLGICGVTAFSGGTEITSFNQRAVKALTRAGFQIGQSTNSENPFYNARMGVDMPPIRMFSKTYRDHSNPQRAFCAILNCSNIDRDCPVIANAEKRIVINYDDPKHYDDTENEKTEYDARCRQISREMCWLFTKALSF